MNENYYETVRKMEASQKSRSDREEEVERTLSCSMPGLLRRLLSENGGSVRPALRELNDRLEKEGMESKVSPNTFYDWTDKYRLR